MQSVSSEFTAAAAATRRWPKAKLDVLWTDPFVMSGITVTADDYARMGDIGQEYYVPGSWHDPHLADTKKSTPVKYLVLDGTPETDGTFYTMPTSTADQQNNQVGWYSAEVCNGSGVFSSHPEATVEFADPRPIRFLIVVGEPTLGQYPVTFEISIYNSSDVLLFNDEYTGTSVETVIDLTSEDISTAKYMILTIKEWSDGDTLSKIVEFFGTVSDTFYTEDIVSIDVLEEREVGKGTVPTGNISSNECDIELQNIHITRANGEEVHDPFFPDNPDSYLQSALTPNVRVIPYLGFKLPDESIEYVKMGTFWTNDWNSEEKNFSVSVSARDRMDLLRLVEFRADEILVGATLEEIADFILEHAKQNVPMNDLVWEIDSSLASYTIPYVWLGKINYMEALAKIAEACMGHVYMTRDDVLKIESYTADASKTSDYTLTRDDYFNRTQTSKSSGLKNRIVVPVSAVELEDDAGEIATEEVSIGSSEDDITVEVEWGDDAVLETTLAAQVINESGVTMSKTSADYYPWGCTVTLHKESGTSGTFELQITGKKLVTTTVTEVIEEDQDSITIYGTREHKYKSNPLLQDETIAGVIATVMLATFKDPRRDLTMEWRGNPACEIGDCATLPVYTPNSTGVSITDDFNIYRQQFSFDGTLRCNISTRKGVDL